jgi:polysaccharide export outer membrane protein
VPDGRPSSDFIPLRCFLLLPRRQPALFLSVLIGLPVLTLLYCLLAPNQYDATAKVALQMPSATGLNLEGNESIAQLSVLSAPLQLETLADVFRSDQLAWRVIREMRLDKEDAFASGFVSRFPDFKPDAPTPAAQQYLLERFQKKLKVQVLPRTLLLSIRFRTRSPALSAKVVNALVNDSMDLEMENRASAMAHASDWLKAQLKDLRARVEQDEQNLADYQSKHQLLSGQQSAATADHNSSAVDPALLELEDLGHQLAISTSERVLAESTLREAEKGDPETVLAGNSQLQIALGLSTSAFSQLRSHKSDLEQEQARLSAEYGPTYPRVVEIQNQLNDLKAQLNAENAKLLERFRRAYEASRSHEELLRAQLDQRTEAALQKNKALMQYELLSLQARASSELLARLTAKLEESGLAAGVRSPGITIVDPPIEPYKPSVPDLPLYMAISIVAALWLAYAAVMLVEALRRPVAGTAAAVLLVALCLMHLNLLRAQAPLPSTQGIPAGVTQPVLTPNSQHPTPNPKEAPQIWNAPSTPQSATTSAEPIRTTGVAQPAPIAAGDILDVSEFHTPEFHSVVRVAVDGSVSLPMLKVVQLVGLDEKAAAAAIEQAFLEQGILLHPHVTVLVTLSQGQDVSVLGEVARPGVYPFTVHHRLLDLLSAASGLSPTSGRLVNVYHRSDPKTPHPVVLDPAGLDQSQDHNPELEPGDTVQVSRAGLVYVVGDVSRPGGFPVDPVHGLTVIQAVSLAWGPTPNAATSKALLIREEKSGRTVTTLNLKRMLSGKDPDLPIHDRDILYVPDSMAKGMINHAIDAAIQSAIGVGIYSGLVFSERY